MEISLENILEKFRLYSGEPLDGADTDRDALCKGLCEDCLRWVQERLKPGAPEECAATMEALAAADAFWQLTMLDQASTPESVQSPELKLVLGDRARYAGLLREEKRRAGAGFLREDSFYFAEA